MESNRVDNVDIIKGICAFLVVCIHAPFPGEVGAYFTTITRIAVPIFFMITGYFYSDIKRQRKEIHQIRKILVLMLEANLLYFIWNITLDVLRGESIIIYIQSVFKRRNLLKFLIFNESSLAGHLWYLGAILYVLVIVLLMDKLNCRKVLYFLTPVLLAADLMFGKYSLLIFHREFPHIGVRNFLCVGIPYFCIGNLIREKMWNPDKKLLAILIPAFALTGMAERFFLVSVRMNATRDHYISTTLLAICFFIYVLKSNWKNERLVAIGRKYSTWIYIMHPIFITIFSITMHKVGIYSIYESIAPIVVCFVTLICLVVLNRVKITIKKQVLRKKQLREI